MTMCDDRTILKPDNSDEGSMYPRYKQIPIVTRGYLTLAVGTTLLCALDVVSPFSLYFNWTAIVVKYEVSETHLWLFCAP